MQTLRLYAVEALCHLTASIMRRCAGQIQDTDKRATWRVITATQQWLATFPRNLRTGADMFRQ